MALTLSHGGDTIYTSSSKSDKVWVGTKEGVALITRSGTGSGWEVSRRALTDKHIHAMIIEPVSGAIFAGATRDSIYASEDGGHTWDRRDNGLTEPDVYSLASARVNGGTRIFAGTEPAHLFYSDDLGHHWAELTELRSVDTSKWNFPAPPYVAHTKHINFHPNDPNTMFISIEVGGLVKSTDGGKTFKAVTGMDDDVHRTVINPLNPDRMYITGGDGTYVTSDGGSTWEHWMTTEHPIGAYPDVCVINPSKPDLVFMASAQYGPGSWPETRFAGSRISKSADGGKTWKPLQGGLPDRHQSAFEALLLEDWGESFSIFGATASGEIWASEDGGDQWSQIISGLPAITKGEHDVLLTPV
jgi:photosystem II stability/assembly factor-like uncharacterized protein